MTATSEQRAAMPVEAIPSFGSVIDPRANQNVKNVIRDILGVPAVWQAIAPYFANGGVDGHKVMDLTDSVNIMIAHDAADGQRIPPFNLSKFVLGNALKNVVREKYALNKDWKIVDLSERVRTAIAAPPTEMPPTAPPPTPV